MLKSCINPVVAISDTKWGWFGMSKLLGLEGIGIIYSSGHFENDRSVRLCWTFGNYHYTRGVVGFDLL